MGKTNMDSSNELKLSKLTGKILESIDIDRLVDSVAEQIGERIMSNFAISDLVDKLFQKYQEELQTQIAEAIVQQL